MTEREFGPNPTLARRRLYGLIIIACVGGFMGFVLLLFGTGEPGSMLASPVGPASDGSAEALSFAAKAIGLAAVAVLVPWLLARRGK